MVSLTLNEYPHHTPPSWSLAGLNEDNWEAVTPPFCAPNIRAWISSRRRHLGVACWMVSWLFSRNFSKDEVIYCIALLWWCYRVWPLNKGVYLSMHSSTAGSDFTLTVHYGTTSKNSWRNGDWPKVKKNKKNPKNKLAHLFSAQSLSAFSHSCSALVGQTDIYFVKWCGSQENCAQWCLHQNDAPLSSSILANGW